MSASSVRMRDRRVFQRLRESMRGGRDTGDSVLERAGRDGLGGVGEGVEEEGEGVEAYAEGAADEEEGDDAGADGLEFGEAVGVAQTGWVAGELPGGEDDEVAY